LKLELTESAVQDIGSISRYTLATWGEEQQNSYIGGLYDKFEEILNYPSRWKFRNDLFPQCQIAKYSRHVILFIVKLECLTVVRVLHDAMDFENQL